MRKIIISEFISLDGVVDSPGGGTFPHAGWTFKDIDFVPDAYEIKGREQLEAGALLLGRVSYEEFAPVWPKMEEFADYNAMPKYIVSSTLDNPQWQNSHVLRSLDEVRELKKTEGGDILVHGSATLAKGLAAAGLVDRYHLLTFPIILGQGKRLFDTENGVFGKLSLVEHATFSNGIHLSVLDVLR